MLKMLNRSGNIGGERNRVPKEGKLETKHVLSFMERGEENNRNYL